MFRKKRLGDILVEAGLLNIEHLEMALAEGKRTKKRLGEVLLDMKIVNEEELAKTLSMQLGYPYINLSESRIDAEAILMIPEHLVRKHNVIPLSFQNGCLTIAMIDPLSFESISDLAFYSGSEVKPVISTRSNIIDAIKHYYSDSSNIESIAKDTLNNIDNTPFQIISDINIIDEEAMSLEEKSRMAPIIRLTNLIITSAVRKRASDIHIEPEKTYVQIRYRIDGILKKEMTLPKWVQGAVVSRIKILATMDITERRLPQDGGVRIMSGKQEVDLRVSTLPTNHGEKVVIRLLLPSNSIDSLEMLGIDSKDSDSVIRLINMKKGIILVTGPTGSGKTTTLYTILNMLKDVSRNIITVENPIEYNLEGITQVQINADIGLTFVQALRSILRQDPDIILVGEIRDKETAEMAMRAAMTGHLVLSTMHTNDASSTIIRLVDIGVPPYLISSLLIGIIAQRLVRRICPKCKEPDNKSFLTLNGELKAIGISAKLIKGSTFYRGKGCEFCGFTGYKGRVGMFEILRPNTHIKKIFSSYANDDEIYMAAIQNGMKTFTVDGIIKAKNGITTLHELLRVIDLQVIE
ncbi:MAG: GspE/PulE family protein [Nitrospirota bacterium]